MSSELFKIRGHHLDRFAELQAGYWSPTGLSKAMVNRHRFMKGWGGEALAHAQDVIGTRKRDERKVQQGLAAVLGKFVDLEPDDLIMITAGEPDGICQSCVIGNHCIDQRKELAIISNGQRTRVYENELADMLAVGKFLRVKDQLLASSEIDPAISTVEVDPTARTEPSLDAIPAADAQLSWTGGLNLSVVEYQDPITVRADLVRAVLSKW